MDLKTLLGIGQSYGEYTILPLTLKDIAEAGNRELASLLLNPVWAFEDEGNKKLFAKWIERKIRKDGKPVTLEQLIEAEYPMPWLCGMMNLLLESSGFAEPQKM